MTTNNKSKTIAKLNDEHRRQGIFTFTQGSIQLPPSDFRELIRLIINFNDFREENDPYGEHDFGKVEVAGENYFWKIDYYSLDGEGASPNPASNKLTRRILTVMRADEY
jgi:hypothetical protein